MRKSMLVLPALFAFAFLFTTALFAQETFPAGTILPVQLNSTVKSNHGNPGKKISGRIMQDVPLPGGGHIRAGTKVIGEVVSVKPGSPTQKAELTLRFDKLMIGKKEIPVTTNLRALASLMDVSEAQVPEMGADRGTPPNWWTTDQIGGQLNYHGHGVITEGGEVVGHSTDDGVLARVSADSRANCRDGVAGNDQLQALWVFASNACGLYGYGDLVLKHAGRTDPKGEITLESAHGDVHVRSGSGMLLRVNQ